MKFFLATVLGLTTIASFPSKIAIGMPADSQKVQCFVNLRPVSFVKERQQSPGIFVRKAALNDTATLIWSYSFYYEKGGAVDLVHKNGKIDPVLIWDNPFEDNILNASVNYGNAKIDCEVNGVLMHQADEGAAAE